MSRRPVLVSLVVLTLALAGAFRPGTAHADAAQLCRSISSILLAPTDVALGPIVAGMDIWYGMQEWDDPMALRIASVVPGFLYLNAMQIGGAIIRVVGGVLEFPRGLVSLFKEGDPGWLFRAHQDARALYANEFGPCPVRIGSSYNTILD